MTTFLMRLLMLPSWFLMRLARPCLPDGHPFRNHKLTLSECAEHGTRTLMVISAALWFSVTAWIKMAQILIVQ